MISEQVTDKNHKVFDGNKTKNGRKKSPASIQKEMKLAIKFKMLLYLN